VPEAGQACRHKRNALFWGACLCGGASIPLFLFNPIHPVGLVAAFDLAFVAIVLVCQALFPTHTARMRQRAERALEKEPHTNIGQWVP
jgi:hypothetical protein